MRQLVVVCLGLLGACGGKGDAPGAGSGSGSAAATFSPQAAGAIAFGDCAASDVAFVSGAKPLPFTADEASGKFAAADDTETRADPGAKDDPPPPEDDGADESGGTGTAMALDEGKMGKRDSDRAEGQYKMRKEPDDPQRAREQAIRAAREAGILGTAALVDDAYGGVIGNEVGEELRVTPAINGGFGFGRAGFGPGGGGTGVGTIGTGRYGTIGGGPSVGGGRARDAVPSVSVGQADANGDLDKAIIRRYIKRNIDKIQYCYEKELLAKPGLAGRLMVQFFITANGTVAAASASGVDGEVASCVAGVIKAIEFPKPKGGGGVQVNYPFVFRAADPVSDKPAPQPEAPPAPPAPRDDRYQEVSVTALLARDGWRSPYRAAEHGPVDPAKAGTGVANPLRAEAAAIADCLKTAKQPYGAAVITLAYQGDRVGNAEVAGLDDPAVTACLAAAARRVKKPAGLVLLGQRCPLAFGAMPEAARPAIAISATGTTFAGKPVAEAAGEAPRDPALVDALVARGVAELARPALAMLPPVALHPEDDAPVAAVLRAITSVIYADGDFTLARKRGADWVTVAPGGVAPAFPTVPVPAGTGGRFAPLLQRAQGHPDGKPYLSVLVQRDRTIVVGQSASAEFTDVAPDADQGKRLVALLRQKKADPQFVERRDLEIAADPSRPYADLLATIDAAVAAGFTDWRITYPGALSALR